MADGVEKLEVDPPPKPHEKLMMYFPEAALALYIALDPMLRQLLNGDAAKAGLWVLLVIVIIFCWMFLTKFWEIIENGTKVISVIALILYIAAIGGPFAATWEGYEPLWASVLAILFTAFIVFFKKVPVKPPPAA